MKSDSIRGARRAREQAFRVRLVVEQAERVFAEHGFQQASIEVIARRAEVAVATLYKLFGSKDQLFQAVLLQRQEEFLGEMERELRVAAPPLERLERLTASVFGYFEEHRHAFRIYLTATNRIPWNLRSSFGDETLARVRRFQEMVAQVFEDGMKRRAWPRGNARKLAAAWVGGVNALLTLRHTAKDPPPLEEDVKAATALLSRLAGARPRRARG